MEEKDKRRFSAELIQMIEENEVINNDYIIDFYSKWAETYDKDTSQIIYNSPSCVCEAAEKIWDNQKDSVVLLDIGAGTGLLTELLLKRGFKNIDGLDGSQKMIEEASKKNIYRQLHHAILGKDKRSSIEKNSYDGVLLAGCLTPGHFDGGCYDELIRLTKKDGYVILAHSSEYVKIPTFKASVVDRIFTLAEEGRWRIIEAKSVPNYYQQNPGMIYILQVC